MPPPALLSSTALVIFGLSRVATQDLPTLPSDADNAPVAPGGSNEGDNDQRPAPGEPDEQAADPEDDTPEGNRDVDDEEDGNSRDDLNNAEESSSDPDSNEVPTETLPDVTSLGNSPDEEGSTPTRLSDDEDDDEEDDKENDRNVPKLKDLPTLSGAFNYPPPSVPPTANAPYMQQSKLPEGTIFIAVGAALGFFALLIIAWRGLVAWSINRSVRKSAAKGYSAVAEKSQEKTDNKHKKPGLYSSIAPTNSTMSLEKLAPGNRTATAGSKLPRESSNLFFSPTAGAGMNSPGNRNSGYLPSGYYASSNAAPRGGNSKAMGGGHGDRSSKLRPHSGVYPSSRTLDPSPPGSPNMPPSTLGMTSQESRSSLNISNYTNNRAPSTYLDDLMSTPPLPQQPETPTRRKRDSVGRH